MPRAPPLSLLLSLLAVAACAALAVAPAPSPSLAWLAGGGSASAGAPASASSAVPAPVTGFSLYDSLYVYGMDDVHGYEEDLLIATVAGLSNRFSPQLYVLRNPGVDASWLSQLQAPGGWLSNASVSNLTAGGAEGLVGAFSSVIDGVVLFDPAVPSTSNVAVSLAGVFNLLPICYRPGDASSLYERLVVSGSGPRLPVARSLVGMFNGSVSGSVKRDAYTWAVDELLRTPGRADGSLLGYYVDAWASGAGVSDFFDKSTAPNFDFVVARGGFAFDLSVWADEAPVDDPTQPLGSDLAAFKYMLNASYASFSGGGARVMHIAGFTPWAFKYVDAAHGGVATEWQTSVLVSSFNFYVDADACCIAVMANGAFFQHYALPARFVQPPPPSRSELAAAGLLRADGSVAPDLFYHFYAGDYDSAAWLYSQLPPRWADAARGAVPIGWGLDPELAIRFPVIWGGLYASMAPGVDVITSGDSGAGYLNPTALYGPARAAWSGLPDGNASWTDWNAAWNRLFGISFTGFVITGDAPQMDVGVETALYAAASGNGLVNQGFAGQTTHLSGFNGSMPAFTQTDLGANATQSAETIVGYFSPTAGAPQFHMFRSVLTSPSYLLDVATQAQALAAGRVHCVTPLAASYLARVALGSNNDNRAGYIGDTLPPAAGGGGAAVNFTATIRNEGWNTLSAATIRLRVSTTLASGILRGAPAPYHQKDADSTGWATRLPPLSHLGVGGALHINDAPLHRRGFRVQSCSTSGGQKRGVRGTAVIATAATSAALFPIGSDIPPSGVANVTASFTPPSAAALAAIFAQECAAAADGALPHLGGTAVEAYVLSVEYGLVAVDADGAVVLDFAMNGVLPWAALVAVPAG